MAEVKIYTTLFCPFCWRAKALLNEKGVAFEEIDVTLRPGARGEMSELAGGRTSVPQIFIGGRAIGGSDELDALEARGELDAALEAA